jgi:hypothetical protein
MGQRHSGPMAAKTVLVTGSQRRHRPGDRPGSGHDGLAWLGASATEHEVGQRADEVDEGRPCPQLLAPPDLIAGSTSQI